MIHTKKAFFSVLPMGILHRVPVNANDFLLILKCSEYDLQSEVVVKVMWSWYSIDLLDHAMPVQIQIKVNLCLDFIRMPK